MRETKKNIKWTYLLGSLLCLSYIIPNQNLKILIVAAVFYSAWMFDLCNATLLLLVSGVLLNYEGSSFVSLISMLPAFVSKRMLTLKFQVKHVIFSVFLLGTLMMSYMFGSIPNINTMILFVMCFIAFTNISQNNIKICDLEKYALFGIVSVCFALVMASQSGGIQIIYGRLAINDSIRELANIISISFFILLLTCLDESKIEGNKIIKITFLGVSSVILLLTLSKGAIIAVIGAFAVMMLRSRYSLTKKVAILSSLMIIVVLAMLFLANDGTFRTDRLFETGTGGFNGRFELWFTYWEVMKSKLLTILFGFGPGDVRRLNITDGYSHSLIFDVLFSYGFFGFTLFVIMIINTLKNCATSKNNMVMGLLVFDLLLYSTHSTATNTSFYIILGIAYALSNQKRM